MCEIAMLVFANLGTSKAKFLLFTVHPESLKQYLIIKINNVSTLDYMLVMIESCRSCRANIPLSFLQQFFADFWGKIHACSPKSSHNLRISYMKNKFCAVTYSMIY